MSNWRRVLEDEMAVNGIQWLALEKEHCEGIVDLPLIHGDPFDRLLVAQASHEDLTIVTRDANISSYEIATLC
ncbi:MAG: type II toxin-antitoxin system VapC family toxin [Candidatus Promineifilaceae bacterium]|nr:type II toxin-antitoxin system VapC family toxin [Candidatus Promineifilaceae bacterium]